jgi:hypothetical protein
MWTAQVSGMCWTISSFGPTFDVTYNGRCNYECLHYIYHDTIEHQDVLQPTTPLYSASKECGMTHINPPLVSLLERPSPGKKTSARNFTCVVQKSSRYGGFFCSEAKKGTIQRPTWVRSYCLANQQPRDHTC